MPVARRVLGEGDQLTLKIRWIYAQVLFANPSATLDDRREGATTLNNLAQTARRVLGGAHPTTEGIEEQLRQAQAALRARETPPSNG